MGETNRKAYVLAATGDIAVVNGRWRSYCRDAFLTREEADAACDGFLERCRAAQDEALGPDPDTLSVKVIALDLEDDLDSVSGKVFMIAAEGRDADIEMRVPFLCRTLYATRDRAEVEMDGFLDRCADPDVDGRHALRETLKGSIGELVLREGPESRPGALHR